MANDMSTDITKNEMIISIYDCCYVSSALINGETPHNEYDIVMEFDNLHTNEIAEFMEKYNIHRLIVCEDGCIEIYTR